MSFWGPAPIREPTKSLFTRTKDTLITQKIPKDLGAQCQVPLYQPRSSGRYKSFKGSVSGPRAETFYILFSYDATGGLSRVPCFKEPPALPSNSSHLVRVKRASHSPPHCRLLEFPAQAPQPPLGLCGPSTWLLLERELCYELA